MRKNSLMIIFAITTMLVLSALVFGQQTTGGIEGTVKDSTGGLVPNATVTISSATGLPAASPQQVLRRVSGAQLPLTVVDSLELSRSHPVLTTS